MITTDKPQPQSREAMTLPADISRCDNDECPLREKCRRWIERNTGRVVSHFEPQGDECDRMIP